MSTNSPSLWPDPGAASPARLARAVSTAVSYVRPLFQATAFWSAIAMPFLYIPLLLGGLTGGEAPAFVGLIAANGLALVLGHGHRQSESRPAEATAAEDAADSASDPAW
jgi:hypothetical protein